MIQLYELNYKIEGNLNILLKMLNNLKNLKHFGISYVPHSYIQKIIKNTNIETLRCNYMYCDKETLNYRRNNIYFG